ncbi:SCO1431 family membrane protein [Streptomyces sp. NEAU-S7GS2]|nr:SCO1431 family membrane protein [Streptomyces sp. NEAU-S7GS2]
MAPPALEKPPRHPHCGPMSTTAATAATAPRTRARTGGPGGDSRLLENILGWTLVVALAMLLTQTGLI